MLAQAQGITCTLIYAMLFYPLKIEESSKLYLQDLPYHYIQWSQTK